MECGAADRGSRKLDRLQDGYWSQGSGATYLDDDTFDPCGCLAGWKFKGDCPAGKLGRAAEDVPLSGGVDFDDHSIHVIIETISLLGPFFPEGDDFIQGRTEAGGGGGFLSPSRSEKRRVGRERKTPWSPHP